MAGIRNSQAAIGGEPREQDRQAVVRGSLIAAPVRCHEDMMIRLLQRAALPRFSEAGQSMRVARAGAVNLVTDARAGKASADAEHLRLLGRGDLPHIERHLLMLDLL